MRKPLLIGTTWLLTLLICGCSQSPSDSGGNHAPATKSQAKGGSSDQGGDPDMVSAVNVNGTSSSLFSMKFKFEGRPVVTSPLEVKILMIPAPGSEISHLQVLFQGSDGLQLQSGKTVDLTGLSGGVPVEQNVTVVPQKSGVLSLSATVLMDTPSESISRTYAIPLIAADGHS